MGCCGGEHCDYSVDTGIQNRVKRGKYGVLGVSHKSGPIAQLAWLERDPHLSEYPSTIRCIRLSANYGVYSPIQKVV